MIDQRRPEDRRWLCRVAGVTSLAWDWFDKRQVLERFVSLSILYGTVRVTEWGMLFAETHGEKTGTEAAAIIAAVLAPYMALQGAAIAFMFRARQ